MKKKTFFFNPEPEKIGETISYCDSDDDETPDEIIKNIGCIRFITSIRRNVFLPMKNENELPLAPCNSAYNSE